MFSFTVAVSRVQVQSIMGGGLREAYDIKVIITFGGRANPTTTFLCEA